MTSGSELEYSRLRAEAMHKDLQRDYPVLLSQIFTELRQEYFQYYPDRFLQDTTSAISLIDWIARMIAGGNPTELQGKSLLDIACGCDPTSGDGFLPITPIFCGAMGMQAIGIDKHPYNGPGAQYYTHICHDLTEPVDFSALTDCNQFDVVQCRLFLDNPGIFTSSPSLLDQIKNNPKRALLILNQVQSAAWNVVSPGGYMLWGANIQQKPFPSS